MKGTRIKRDFFCRDVLEVAPALLGKTLVRLYEDGSMVRNEIREVEAYRGTKDLACHASKGRTERTEVMFHSGGNLYIYLVYGMYWMLNIVSGMEGIPQAVLIRGTNEFDGPGKLTRGLGIDKSFYGEDLTLSNRIWIEDAGKVCRIDATPRIGIDYAGEYWKSRKWRFLVGER